MGMRHRQLTSLGSANRTSVGDTASCDADRAEPAQACDELVDQPRRCRRAGGDSDPADARQPVQVDVAGVVDEVGPRPRPSATSTRRSEFDELTDPTTRTRSQSRRDLAHGLLPVGRGVADVVAARAAQRREAVPQHGATCVAPRRRQASSASRRRPAPGRRPRTARPRPRRRRRRTASGASPTVPTTSSWSPWPIRRTVSPRAA